MSAVLKFPTISFSNPFYPSKGVGPVSVKEMWRLRSFRSNEVAHLSPAQVKELVGLAATHVKAKKEALQFIDLISKSLPMQGLEDAIREDIPHYKDAIDAANQMHVEAKYYLQRHMQGKQFSVVETLVSVFQSIVIAIENFLRSFGLIDLFNPLPYTHFSEVKGQQVAMLSTFFSALTSSLIPVIGASQAGLAVGGIFLSLLALSASHSRWRPMPTYLPMLENWTDKFRQGTIEAGLGRKMVLDELVGFLSPENKSYGHVMLVGGSGVGKTEIIKSLIQSIEKGDYPHLKGKHVYYVNTADLFSRSDWLPHGQNFLTFFNREIGRHRDNVIFVFDQIHVACRSGKDWQVVDQLKSFLDLPKESFPYVIAVTTKEDYDRDIASKHSGFIDRFHRIFVDETNLDESFYIMSESLLKDAPEVLLEEGALTYLLEKTKEVFGDDAVMPRMALNVLSECIQRTSRLQKSDTESRIEKLRSDLELESLERILGQGRGLLPYGKDSMATIEKELSELEERAKLEKLEVSRLFELRKLLLDLKKSSYEMVLKVTKGRGEKDKKAFLLLTHFFTPALESEILELGNRLGIKVRVDKALIDHVLKEESEKNIKR